MINRLLILISLFSIYCLQLNAQDARVLDLDNVNAYNIIERFVISGKFQKLNPTKLPYKESDIYKELKALNYDELTKIEKIWFEQLAKEIGYSKFEEHRDYIIDPVFLGGSEFNNTRRKNSYRPIGSDLHAWPYAELGFYADYKNITVNNNIRFDLYYEFDPDGLDPTQRLYMRNENSYISYKAKYIDVLFGRVENQWGMYNGGATFISDNALPFDQLNYTIGTERFSFTSVTGVLDNIETPEAVGNDPIAKRRFIALKRIDWKVNNALTLTFKESNLYSGLNANLEPRVMIPSAVFFFLEEVQRNNIENLMIGGSIFYKKNNFSLFLDVMLDDLITKRVERGITEKNNFSFVLNSTYLQKNRLIQYNLDFELYTYQAYNTDQIEGRYLYYGRGLASQFNDYIFTQFKLDYFADLKLKGLRLSPYVGMLNQGEQVIDQTFQSTYENGDELEYVLTGTVENTYRFGLNLHYYFKNNLWFRSDLGYNIIKNAANLRGNNKSQFNGMAELGFRISLANHFK